MLILSRVVRFAVNPASERHQAELQASNGFAGIPAMNGIGRYFELNVICGGHPDHQSGYLMDIKEIDRAVRAAVVPRIADACANRPATDPASLMPQLLPPLDEALGGRLIALRWMLTPYYSVEMSPRDMNTRTVLLRQKFDFAASHRLHIPHLSDEENRRLFGKCNHPGGHGHNYQFEPCIAMRLNETEAEPPFALHDLERIADEFILRRFDHKHLNIDTPEFSAERGGVNPTVENIARVFFELLRDALQREHAPVELRAVTVWETDRTSATYPA